MIGIRSLVSMFSSHAVAPGGGYGFGPRHLDFHPTKPWMYLSLETQNKLDIDNGGQLMFWMGMVSL